MSKPPPSVRPDAIRQDFAQLRANKTDRPTVKAMVDTGVLTGVTLSPSAAGRNVITAPTGVFPLELVIDDGVDTALQVRDLAGTILASLSGDAGLVASTATIESVFLAKSGGTNYIVLPNPAGGLTTTITLPNGAIPANKSVIKFTTGGAATFEPVCNTGSGDPTGGTVGDLYIDTANNRFWWRGTSTWNYIVRTGNVDI